LGRDVGVGGEMAFYNALNIIIILILLYYIGNIDREIN
jgi:hypothetical protein